MIRELSEEVLVYDLSRNRAYCLNRIAARVWRSCDGQLTVQEIADVLRGEIDPAADETAVWDALYKLQRARLLENRVSPPLAAVSRREVLKRIGIAAAITSIIAPTAANAQTIAGTISKATCRARRVKTTGCGNTPCTTGGNCRQFFKTNFCNCQ